MRWPLFTVISVALVALTFTVTMAWRDSVHRASTAAAAQTRVKKVSDYKSEEARIQRQANLRERVRNPNIPKELESFRGVPLPVYRWCDRWLARYEGYELVLHSDENVKTLSYDNYEQAVSVVFKTKDGLAHAGKFVFRFSHTDVYEYAEYIKPSDGRTQAPIVWSGVPRISPR